jgi:hypothetical protein
VYDNWNLFYPTNPKCNIHKLQHVRLLHWPKQWDAGVHLGWEHVDKHWVLVQCNGQHWGLEKPTVDCAQDSNIVFALVGGGDDAIIDVDHLHEPAAKTPLNQKMKIQKHLH